MGYVIAAYDETEGTRIAVKRLLPELRDDRSRGMFTREAKLLTQLRHPNIVRGIAFGEDDDGPYLVMDLVLGTTLDTLIAASPSGIPAPLACRVVADICAGLSAAHELCDEDGRSIGLVHRDVTPHNVVLDVDGRVLLFDFGVAKIDRSSRLSKTGEVKGKTGYMSPEQAMGDAIDPRSDLFAVGAILFELLTGKKMWSGTEMEVLRSLALASPPPLPESVDPRLRALYTSLVARDRNARPASARAVFDELTSMDPSSPEELATFLRERLPGKLEDAKLRLDNAVTKAGRPLKGRRRLSVLGGAATFLLGFVALLWGARNVRPSGDSTDLPVPRAVSPSAVTGVAPSGLASVAPMPTAERPEATRATVTATASGSARPWVPTTSARPIRSAHPPGSASATRSSDVDPNPI